LKLYQQDGRSLSKVCSILFFISLGVTRDSFIGSRPFRFLIGPDKKTVYVHTELVVQHSSALAALVSGRMAEAKESCAFLEDVDEGTFVRFVEYMYTNDYPVPDPVIVQMASDSTFENGQDGIEETAAVDEPQPTPIHEDDWSSKKDGKKKKASRVIPGTRRRRQCKNLSFSRRPIRNTRNANVRKIGCGRNSRRRHT
jgi:hypothetical protein